jgi:hypothetical protein
MRTIQLGAFVIGLLALSVAQGAAQPALVLNVMELQKLVSSGTPTDNAQLAAHFTALANQSASEARRHHTMSSGFGVNPNRQLGTQMAPHCNRLAKLNKEAAATLRELAAHHQTLAAGAPSIAPSAGAAYQSGRGARVPTENDLKDLAAKAHTVADHHALMEYFSETAKRQTAAADDHVRMAQSYRGGRIASAAVHCDHLMRVSREAAKEATAAATMHKDLAGIGR